MNKLINNLAIKENCFVYNDITYERLYNHPLKEKFRFFTDNDYDYVEDKELIQTLERVFDLNYAIHNEPTTDNLRLYY